MGKVTRIFIGAVAVWTLACSSALAAEILDSNILTNGGFESGLTGWTVVTGSGTTRSSDPAPHGGSAYFAPDVSDALVTINQDINLAALGYDAHRLATGGYRVSVGGWQYAELLEWSTGQITLKQYDAGGTVIGTTDFDEMNELVWTDSQDTFRMEAGTTRLRYVFQARDYSVANQSYLDDASVEISKYYIWTYGSVSTGAAKRSDWTVATEYRVGDGGTGELNVTEGRIWTTEQLAYLGYAGGVGTVNIDGASSTWASSGDAYVGSLGTGEANLANGGTWTTATGHTTYLGNYSGGSGTVNIDGTGSKWTALGEVHIGEEGTGVVTLSNGGTWTTASGQYALVGYGSGSSGTVNVDGAGSKWTANGYTHIGEDAAGIVTLSNGGAWTTTEDAYLGYASGSSGQVNIDGVGSNWTASGGLRIGDDGTGVMNLTNGGTCTTSYSHLGWGLGSSGQVNIGGAGSNWTTLGVVYVGMMGSSEVNLTNGGTWMADSNVTLSFSSSFSGTVNIDGAGSEWTAAGTVYLGKSGMGVMNLTNGGAWATASGETVFLGDNPGSSGTMNIDGTGSTWTASGGVHLGYDGTGVMNLTNDGEFIASNNVLTIGSQGTLNIDGGVATLNAGLTNNGAVNLNSGTLRIAGGTGTSLDAITQTGGGAGSHRRKHFGDHQRIHAWVGCNASFGSRRHAGCGFGRLVICHRRNTGIWNWRRDGDSRRRWRTTQSHAGTTFARERFDHRRR